MDDTLEINITYETYKNTPLALHNNPKQIKHLQIICNEEWFMGLCKDESYIWSHKIWTYEMPPCILFTNIVNFTNLISLTLEAVALDCDLSKIIHFDVEYFVSLTYTNLYEEIYEILKTKLIDKYKKEDLDSHFIFKKWPPNK